MLFLGAPCRKLDPALGLGDPLLWMDFPSPPNWCSERFPVPNCAKKCQGLPMGSLNVTTFFSGGWSNLMLSKCMVCLVILRDFPSIWAWFGLMSCDSPLFPTTVSLSTLTNLDLMVVDFNMPWYPDTYTSIFLNGCFSWMMNQIFTSKMVGNSPKGCLGYQVCSPRKPFS